MKLRLTQIPESDFIDWFEHDVPEEKTLWLIVTEDGQPLIGVVSTEILLIAWEAVEFESGIELVRNRDDKSAVTFPVGTRKAKRQRFISAMSEAFQ